MKTEIYYQKCGLCPRECHVDRLHGETGFCRETSKLRITSFIPHFGEEPPINGTKGSGTVFFSGCTGRCFFCQNYQISLQNMGKHYTTEDFYHSLKGLIDKGVHNLNFVTPEHYLPTIAETVFRLRAEGLNLPVLLNSSGFFSRTALDIALSFTDIFLPDFKFLDRSLSKRILKFPDYTDYAIPALDRIINEKGFLEFSSNGKILLAVRGVLVRHLILPGYTEKSIETLQFLRERYGRYLPVSVLSQYTPLPGLPPPYNRPINRKEYESVLEEIYRLDFETVYIQEFPADSRFFPDFNRENPFEKASVLL